MKKLAVVGMIIVLAMFVAVAMASADGRDHWRGIRGTYAMSATGNCLHWWSTDPTKYGASNMVQGFFRFHRDGTGTVWGNNYPITPPPAPAALVGCGNGEFSWDFTYKVTHDGAITVWMKPGSFKGKNLVNGWEFVSDNCGTGENDRCTLFGMVSSDHEAMSLATGASPDGSNAQGFTFVTGLRENQTFYANCSYARILFRVSDQDDD